MKISKETPDKYQVQLTIEVDAEKLAGAKKNAAKNLSDRMSIPGFRKGKAPMEVVERHVGKQSLMDEAAEILIRDAATDALKEEKLSPVDDVDYDVVTCEDGKNFVFTMKFTPYPEVKLGEYKGLTIEKTVEEVTDEDVDKQLEVLRDHHAVLTDAASDDAIVKDDFITLDFDGYIDGKPFEGGSARSHPLTIGSGTFIAGFEEKLIGAKVGDELDIDVTFPWDYHDKRYAGRPATFKCKILSIKHRQLPELNDEFAAKVSTFKTLDELKENVRRNMIASAENAAIERQQQDLIDAITDKITVDLPPVMIEDQIDKMIRERELQVQAYGMTMEEYFQQSGHTMDELRESMRDDAEHTVRVNLMIEAVAKAENVQVDDQDYRYELAMLAATYNIPPKEIQKIIRKERQGALLVSNALRRKVLGVLIQSNIAPEVDGEKAAVNESTQEPDKASEIEATDKDTETESGEK